MMLIPSRAIVASLVLLNALLVAVVVYEFAGLNLPNSEETEQVDNERLEIPVQRRDFANNRTFDDYSVMTRRPLFNKDRIPVQKEDSANSQEDALAFTLVGVVLTPEQQVAIIYSKNQEQPVKVALWDWIDGWRLTEIQNQGVVLRKGNRSLELTLTRTSQAEAK